MRAALAWISTVLTLQSTPPSSLERVKVFLGAAPSAEGFTTANREFDETYRDIRDEFGKETAFQSALELVQTADEADLILEVIDRGLRDTGGRTAVETPIGDDVVLTSSVPTRQKAVFARLAVRGTGYKIDLDGRQGIKLKMTYRNQAKSLLRQVVDWVKANRGALERARENRRVH